MTKFVSGDFYPSRPGKYMGSCPARYRSGWELAFMQFLDTHPSIQGWNSEGISIPYRNPFTGKWTMYIPDFLVVYIDKNSKKHVEMIEIKPEKELPGYKGRVNSRTKLVQAINAAKWQAALAFCVKRGWSFRVATEKELFGYKKKS